MFSLFGSIRLPSGHRDSQGRRDRPVLSAGKSFRRRRAVDPVPGSEFTGEAVRAEAGSEEVDAATRTSAASATAVIGQVEMAAALARGVRMDALSPEDAHPEDLTQLLDTWGD